MAEKKPIKESEKKRKRKKNGYTGMKSGTFIMNLKKSGGDSVGWRVYHSSEYRSIGMMEKRESPDEEKIVNLVKGMGSKVSSLGWGGFGPGDGGSGSGSGGAGSGGGGVGKRPRWGL